MFRAGAENNKDALPSETKGGEMRNRASLYS